MGWQRKEGSGGRKKVDERADVFMTNSQWSFSEQPGICAYS